MNTARPLPPHSNWWLTSFFLIFLLGCNDESTQAAQATDAGQSEKTASTALNSEGDSTESERRTKPTGDDGGDAGENDTDPTEKESGDADREAEEDGVRPAASGAEDLAPHAKSSHDLDAGVTDCQPFKAGDDCVVSSDGVLPTTLACTGLYGDPTTRALACGVDTYEPAFSLWSDGTHKTRYLRLPVGSSIDITEPEAFQFPVGTQLWKEFAVDVDGARRRAETRLLQKTDSGWMYATYVWDETGTTAVQENAGVDRIFGTDHSVPTREQCQKCHQGRPDFALGWDPVLMGSAASGLTLNVLAATGRAHVRDSDGQPAMPARSALTASIPGNDTERAALGYLHVNCGVSCHSDTSGAAGGDTGLRMRLDLNTLNDGPAQTDAITTAANRIPGIHAKLPPGGPYYNLLPGAPDQSLLLARMAVRSEMQMPPLGTNLVDAAGLELIRKFIGEMSSNAGYPAPDDANAGLSPEQPTEAQPVIPESVIPEPTTPEPIVPAGCSTSIAPELSGLGYSVVVDDDRLSTLTFAAQPPGDDDWYLVEMRGRIMRLRDGVLEDEPFLDLSDAIALGAGFDQTSITYDERGLVGLAFAPDFKNSGLFYVTITPSQFNVLGLPLNEDLVVEYRASDSGGAPVLQRILVDVPNSIMPLGNIHNANTVRFGPDGMLYVGMGDGGGIGCGNAELGASQRVDNPFGKLLRLDTTRPYPHAAAGNPFATGGDPRVLHYGLRNPFRFSFDRATGDMYIGDVGQDTFEELNFAPAGAQGLNFGWATFEAESPCPLANRPLRPGSSHSGPIFYADRWGAGRFSDYRAIVGGIVYRGAALPKLAGVYLFGDYYGDRLGGLYQCGSSTSDVSVLRKTCNANFPEACLDSTSSQRPGFDSLTAIVEDHAGEIYFVANGNSLLKLVAR